MVFNLLMKRRVFAVVNTICADYQDKFHEKVATASVVNVLIAEGLTARGLIPKEFVEQEYGCPDPINLGFTAKARNEKVKTGLEIQKEQLELEKKAKAFSMVLDQWSLHPDPKWRSQWIAEAEKWKGKVANAELVLALVNGEARPDECKQGTQLKE
jgi:hypothetical protein